MMKDKKSEGVGSKNLVPDGIGLSSRVRWLSPQVQEVNSFK